ncbi:type III secretion protein HrpB4 [Burkholderia cenocepacia]|uniref:type III secretion protein HrpB4 n=1 Tax=Burkholderia cenocepacia TaxID=95486 RepID=UPI000A420217|nr:type III secretion protein HrpB4 [Burkholderia cenocepacia]
MTVDPNDRVAGMASMGEPMMSAYDAADAYDAAADRVAAPHGETPAAVAARLAAYHRRRRTLFDWMHPAWLARVPGADRIGACSPAQAEALADALLDEWGMPVPPLAAFNAPETALALLPAHDCLTVFRLRALVEQAEPLRAWIDRPRREKLTGWIGARGVNLLFARGRELAGDARSLAARAHHAAAVMQVPLDAADGDDLAWLGFRLFARDRRWAPGGPLAIMRLAMPARDDGGPLPFPSLPPSLPSSEGSSPSLSIVSQLPDLFPEGSW